MLPHARCASLGTLHREQTAVILGKGMRVLVLAPHTDDAEIGCGATMARLIEELEADLTIVNLSAAEESVAPEFDPAVNRQDCVAAGRVLGVEDVRCMEFLVRIFPAHRQEVLQVLYELNKELRPDLVLGPSSTDHHQDHVTIYEESRRAFSGSSILGYEIPWSCRTFNADLTIAVTDSHIERKMESVWCYRSQRQRSYTRPDVLLSSARHRGMQSANSLAEAFEVIRIQVR